MAKVEHGNVVTVERITQAILVLRGKRVLLDAELAALYGVSTARLNQQVRRNRTRFPEDFLFELSAQEFAELKLHSATSSWGGRRTARWRSRSTAPSWLQPCSTARVPWK